MTALPVDKTHTTSPAQNAQNLATPACHVLDEVADVRFLPSGLPLALRWQGRLWQVIDEPVPSSSSSSWREPATTPPAELDNPSGLCGQGAENCRPTDLPEPRRVCAWVRYPSRAIRVQAHAIAYTRTAIRIRFLEPLIKIQRDGRAWLGLRVYPPRTDREPATAVS